MPSLVTLHSARTDQPACGVSRREVSEMTNLVDEHRAPRATRAGPAVHAGRKHEVIQDQLTARVEEISEAQRPRHRVRGWPLSLSRAIARGKPATARCRHA